MSCSKYTISNICSFFFNNQRKGLYNRHSIVTLRYQVHLSGAAKGDSSFYSASAAAHPPPVLEVDGSPQSVIRQCQAPPSLLEVTANSQPVMARAFRLLPVGKCYTF